MPNCNTFLCSAGYMHDNVQEWRDSREITREGESCFELSSDGRTKIQPGEDENQVPLVEASMEVCGHVSQ